MLWGAGGSPPPTFYKKRNCGGGPQCFIWFILLVAYFDLPVQLNFVTTIAVDTNFRKRRTNILTNLGPYSGISIDITSDKTNTFCPSVGVRMNEVILYLVSICYVCVIVFLGS